MRKIIVTGASSGVKRYILSLCLSKKVKCCVPNSWTASQEEGMAKLAWPLAGKERV